MSQWGGGALLMGLRGKLLVCISCPLTSIWLGRLNWAAKSMSFLSCSQQHYRSRWRNWVKPHSARHANFVEITLRELWESCTIVRSGQQDKKRRSTSLRSLLKVKGGCNINTFQEKYSITKPLNILCLCQFLLFIMVLQRNTTHTDICCKWHWLFETSKKEDIVVIWYVTVWSFLSDVFSLLRKPQNDSQTSWCACICVWQLFGTALLSVLINESFCCVFVGIFFFH